MGSRGARTLVLGIAGLVAVVAWVGLVLLPPGARSPTGSRPSIPSPDAMASLPPALTTEEVYAAFAEGGAARSAGERTVLSTVRAGDLLLPTGRLVANDVFFLDREPFTRRLPVGRHPVLLLASASAADVIPRVAAALIRVGPGDPVSWELALVPGQDPAALQPGEFFGYGVDSGTGSFASAEAAAAVTGGDFDAYSDQIHHGMYPSEDVVDWNILVELVVDPATGANVIAFSSGFGDGAYPSWFGLDARGEPVVLLTDFGILQGSAP